MTPDETLAIKELVLEKVRRQARTLVSHALLESANLEIVSDMLADNVVRALFTVEMLGKKEQSEWSDSTLYPGWGVRNGIKLWLRTQWPINRLFPDFDAERVRVVTHDYRATYHMCPHINDWSGDRKALHIRWLDSVPRPPQSWTPE